jgi:hypothetical protein
MRSVIDDMSRPAPYERELRRLCQKARPGHTRGQAGVPLVVLGQHAREVARHLAQAVARGTYRGDPVVVRRRMVKGKERLLYTPPLLDTVVQRVAAGHLHRLVLMTLSPRVFSYQEGRSSWQALAELGAYLAEHRRVRARPKDRGLFVIQRDIKAYTDNIPVASWSPLWPMLRASCEHAGAAGGARLFELLRGMLRPEVIAEEGGLLCRITGVPTGTPPMPPVSNLYLSPADELLQRIPGAFYARFGDDILFAHPDAQVAREAAAGLDRIIGELHLTSSGKRPAQVYFTGPGRPSSAWPECHASSQLEYLGCRVGFLGRTSLSRRKLRELLADLRQRIRRTAALLAGDSGAQSERLSTLCAVVNRMLDPNDAQSTAAAGLLRVVLNDRSQLEQLDYRIALTIAETASGWRGPRAFRDVPYRTLRRDAGLRSLVAARNAVGRRE